MEDVTLYTSHSPGTAPSDYHLFQCFQRLLNSKSFSNDDDMISLSPQILVGMEQNFMSAE